MHISRAWILLIDLRKEIWHLKNIIAFLLKDKRFPPLLSKKYFIPIRGSLPTVKPSFFPCRFKTHHFARFFILFIYFTLYFRPDG
ncbi:hypothetical protein DM01DRAFT_1124617 [Hesseltinella vesiculosa]|uniref:Uncharacterized protein n=1 Tax=Hesseltinella vesiculosa TaxID=101127 RepID=A0A1X2GU60_9FUNG|nr:hypothetical protein DM01DRAFT_1124617 [Hesseltinella vesiculosa]